MRCFVVRRRVLGLGFCALLCASVLGCGSGKETPSLFPVTGKVTYQGKPVVGATVVFVPDAKPDSKSQLAERISGETDDDGNYAILWGERVEGAPEGKYKVVVTAVEPFVDGEDSEAPRTNLIPDNYGNPQTSGLTAVVKDEDGENVANFELQ